MGRKRKSLRSPFGVLNGKTWLKKNIIDNLHPRSCKERGETPRRFESKKSGGLWGWSLGPSAQAASPAAAEGTDKGVLSAVRKN